MLITRQECSIRQIACGDDNPNLDRSICWAGAANTLPPQWCPLQRSKIVSASPRASMVAGEVAGPPVSSDADAFTACARAQTGLAYHPAGTCRMRSDTEAIVGPDLRIKGLDNV